MKTDTTAKQKQEHNDPDAGIKAREISYSIGFRIRERSPIQIMTKAQRYIIDLALAVCDMPLPTSATEAGTRPIQSVDTVLPVIALKESTARCENLSPFAGRRKASKLGIT
jgi:hypothetical protein